MKKLFDPIIFILSLALCSCSYYDSQAIQDQPATDCALIYKTNSSLYKDYLHSFDIDNLLRNHYEEYCFQNELRYLYCTCLTQDNVLYTWSILYNGSYFQYKLDLINCETKEITYITSLYHNDLIEKFNLSEEEYNLSNQFSISDGLLDNNNPDFLFRVAGQDIHKSFLFEIVFDKTTYNILYFDCKPDSSNEKDECLKRTGATIEIIEKDYDAISALNIGGELYAFENGYLSKHSDFFPSLRISLIKECSVTRYFLRIDSAIYLILSLSRPAFFGTNELEKLIYKISVKDKFAHYIGYLNPYEELKGVLIL